MHNLKRNDSNELTKQKETHRLRERTYGCQAEGWGKGRLWSLGWTCIHEQPGPAAAQGTLPGVTWQPGWKGSLEENGYMHMYG